MKSLLSKSGMIEEANRRSEDEKIENVQRSNQSRSEEIVLKNWLSAELKRKQKQERLLPITMGGQIHANNAVAAAFFFYDPTADDDG